MASDIIKDHGLPDIVIHCSCDLPRNLKPFPSTTVREAITISSPAFLTRMQNYEITSSIQDGLLMPIYVR
eukprot:750463-Hanusia_phi.AAC.1